MEKLFEELVLVKQELKSAIEASEVRLQLKIESYNGKIRNLEKENQNLRRKVEILERNTKKNNIVVFGLHKGKEEFSVDNICNKLNSHLGVRITRADINDTYLLGRSQNCPVKVEFISNLTKINVLRNCNKLKGTGVTISADLTKVQQQNHKILRSYLKKLRETGEEGCYIKGEKLYRNNIGYTAEEILEIEETIETVEPTKVSSAPPTPSRTTVTEDKREEYGTHKNTEKKDVDLKDIKKKTISNKQADTSYSKGNPDNRERKNSARDIQTRSSQRK